MTLQPILYHAEPAAEPACSGSQGGVIDFYQMVSLSCPSGSLVFVFTIRPFRCSISNLYRGERTSLKSLTFSVWLAFHSPHGSASRYFFEVPSAFHIVLLGTVPSHRKAVSLIVCTFVLLSFTEKSATLVGP